MLANSAVAAALVFLASLFWLLARTTFLAPFKRVILLDYGWVLLVGAALTYLNLVAAFYLVGRVLFLRTSGAKLTHIDRQLASADTIASDLSAQISKEAGR